MTNRKRRLQEKPSQLRLRRHLVGGFANYGAMLVDVLAPDCHT